MKRADYSAVTGRVLDDPEHPLWNLLPHRVVRAATGQDPLRTLAILNLGLWAERWLHLPPQHGKTSSTVSTPRR
jgi:hypothetical protein